LLTGVFAAEAHQLKHVHLQMYETSEAPYETIAGLIVRVTAATVEGVVGGSTWGVVRKSLMAAPIEVAFVACPWATLAAASAASSPPEPPLSNPISAVNICMRVS
jgi:hypothetical protein